MEELELLNVIEWGLRAYRDKKLDNKFGLMEFYSLTDLEAKQVARLARKYKKASLANSVLKFNEDYYWLRQNVNMSEKLRLMHAAAGHELTADEKLTIYEKLQSEGFPNQEGVFNYAARLFVTEGVDSISKEGIKTRVMTAYNEAHGIQPKTTTSQKTLVK